jgi:hypothetical protein
VRQTLHIVGDRGKERMRRGLRKESAHSVILLVRGWQTAI